MPSIPVQPSTIRPTPLKECLEYCIIPFEFVNIAGAYASAFIDFDATPRAGGQPFTFAGFEFLTSNSATPTYKTFQIGADGQVSAGKFRDALNLNAYFFGFVGVVITEQGAGVWRAAVTWNTPGPRPNWEFDFTGVSPALANGNTPGAEVTLKPGFKLRYQLWGIKDGDTFPITEIEALTPRVTDLGNVPRVCLDFKDDVKGLASATFPGQNLSDIEPDPSFLLDVFLKYGAYQLHDCVITEYNWITSNVAKVVASVFQIDDKEKFRPYNHGDTLITGSVLPLTKRPQELAMPNNAYFWLWAYLTRMAGGIYSAYRVQWDYRDAAGITIGTFFSPSSPTEDGVYVFPAGPGNSPGIPAGTKYVRTAVQGLHNDFSWINVTAPYEVAVGTPCPMEEFYFVEDMGAYSTIHFDEITDITHSVETQIQSRPENCVGDPHDRDLDSRLQGGGFSRFVIKSWPVFKATLTGMDTPERYDWLRQFLDSENILWRYTAQDGNNVIRKIILEPGETLLHRGGVSGEYLTVEIVFRFHTNNR